jgi:hypothetical protein
MFLRVSLLGLGAATLLGLGCSAGMVSPGDVRDEVGVVGDHSAGVDSTSDVVVWDDSGGEASAEETTFAIASAAAKPTQVIFLNRAGRTYTGGSNDSERGTSSIVGSRGGSVTVPPAPFSDPQWTQIVGCVQKEYADYNVVITDKRPQSGAYVEAAVGGLSSLLGLGASVSGISPMRCGTIPRSVAFVFADHPALKRSVEETCITIAHEVGHSVGLEHSPIAADPMTYLRFNGHKTFQDQVSQCGTGQDAAQPCQCNNGTQNTVQRLLTNLGPASSSPPPTDPPPTDPPPASGALAVTSPAEGAVLPANSKISVSVEASGASLSAVALFWELNQSRLPCDDSVAGVSCVQNGSTFTWTISVGSGERRFHAVGRDGGGHDVASATRTIQLRTATPPQTPSLTVTSPAAGSEVEAGGPVTIEGAISDDTNLGPVTVEWTRPATGNQPEQTVSFPLTRVARGAYKVTLQVSESAAAGERRIKIVSSRDGQRLASAATAVQIKAGLIAP